MQTVQSIVTLGGFLAFLLYFVTGVLMLVAFAKFYTMLTPYNEFAEIRDRNRIGPAITLAGALLGFTFPLCSIGSHSNYIGFLVWGIIAGLVQIGTFLSFYYLAEKKVWDDMMEDRNLAAAILYGGFSVAIGLLNAFSLVP